MYVATLFSLILSIRFLLSSLSPPSPFLALLTIIQVSILCSMRSVHVVSAYYCWCIQYIVSCYALFLFLQSSLIVLLASPSCRNIFLVYVHLPSSSPCPLFSSTVLPFSSSLYDLLQMDMITCCILLFAPSLSPLTPLSPLSSLFSLLSLLSPLSPLSSLLSLLSPLSPFYLIIISF